MIAFAHTKFGLVQMKESGVKRGGGRIPPPPRPERVFEISAWTGLNLNHCLSDLLLIVNL